MLLRGSGLCSKPEESSPRDAVTSVCDGQLLAGFKVLTRPGGWTVPRLVALELEFGFDSWPFCL